MSPADDHSGGRQEAKYYVIFLHAIPERPLSPEVVNLHAAHLAELDDSGKLVMAGPLPERSGGLIVLRTGSVAEAKAIADEDPLVRGAYQTYELDVWLMSNRQNNYRPNIHTAADNERTTDSNWILPVADRPTCLKRQDGTARPSDLGG